MRLFGGTSSYTLGVIWDRRKLDLSDAFIWPSGYFAKSDYNVDANGRLLNGREKALVTLEQLMHSNETKTYRHQLTGDDVTEKVLPYNEVLTFVEGVVGIVGICVRSSEITHLLWALGIRSLLQRALPALGELPLFVHDPERGMRPVGRAAQSKVVHEFLQALHPHAAVADGTVGMPCMPIDTRLLELSVLEQIRFHGTYGLTSDALSSVLQGLAMNEASDTSQESSSQLSIPQAEGQRQMLNLCPDAARTILAFGLHQAVLSDNSASAMSLLRLVAPVLFSATTVPNAALSLAGRAGTAQGQLVRSCSSDSRFSDVLHRICSRSFSRGVLVAVGSLVALEDFASGRMLPRIVEACHQLEGWLDNSNSFVFRVGSWHELSNHSGAGHDAAFSAFVTKRAVGNRRQFHDELLELERLEESRDLLHGMQHLRSLISHLHHPCLRLEILQHILGLDSRFDLSAVQAVANLALSIIAAPGSTPRAEDEPILPKDSRATSFLRLEAAACHMQGLVHPEVDAQYAGS